MKYLAKVLYPIKVNIVFFVFLYLLGVLTTVLECWGLNFKIQRFNFFSYFLDIYLLCVFLMILPRRIRGMVRGIMAIWAYVIAIVEVFCVETFRARIGPDILNAMLDTNQREASEFAGQYIGVNVLTSGVGLILLMMILHVMVAFRQKQVEMLLKPIFLPLRRKYVKGMTTILLLGFLCLCFYLCGDSRLRFLRLMNISEIEEVDSGIDNFTLNTPTGNLLFSLKMRQLANEGLNVLAATQEHISVDSCEYKSNNIIIIIGESYIKCHSQLYGYQLPTTPRQMERTVRSEKGCLVPFSDVVSPSNLTSVVFKNAFSLHSIEDSANWSYYPLFPVLFRKAGYRTVFATNQFVPSLGADIFNVSGGLFLNDSRLSKAMFTSRNMKAHRYDMELLGDLDSLDRYKIERQLTMIHLAGQHIDYYKRCPPEKRKFEVVDYPFRKDLDDAQKKSVADYDNATLYNDEVLDSILTRYEKEDAIVIYMPDHGEECYDEIKRIGRMPGGTYTSEVLRQEYRIPFWIWCSDRYIENHQSLFEEIQSAKDRPFMIDDLPHLLLFLAGIHTPFYNEERCIISDSFDVSRRRLINGIVDYDQVVDKR